MTEENIWAKAAAQLNEWNHGRTAMTDQTLKKRRAISDADATDAIDWVERIALAIATTLG